MIKIITKLIIIKHTVQLLDNYTDDGNNNNSWNDSRCSTNHGNDNNDDKNTNDIGL